MGKIDTYWIIIIQLYKYSKVLRVTGDWRDRVSQGGGKRREVTFELALFFFF